MNSYNYWSFWIVPLIESIAMILRDRWPDNLRSETYTTGCLFPRKYMLNRALMKASLLHCRLKSRKAQLRKHILMELGNDQKSLIQALGIEAKGNRNSRLNWSWPSHWKWVKRMNLCPINDMKSVFHQGWGTRWNSIEQPLEAMLFASSPVVGRPLPGFSNPSQQLIRKGRSREAKQKPQQAMSQKSFFCVSCSSSWPWPAPCSNGLLDMFSVTLDHLKWQDLWILRL